MRGPHFFAGADPSADFDVYVEVSPLGYPRFGTPAQRIGLISPDAGPTTETYFAPTERTVRRGAGGRLLKKPRIEITPGARPGTVAWLDWHPLGPGAAYIDFMTVRPDWRGYGLGRQLVEAFYAYMIDEHELATIDWGEIMHPNAVRLYQQMRARFPQIAHRARF